MEPLRGLLWYSNPLMPMVSLLALASIRVCFIAAQKGMNGVEAS